MRLSYSGCLTSSRIDFPSPVGSVPARLVPPRLSTPNPIVPTTQCQDRPTPIAPDNPGRIDHPPRSVPHRPIATNQTCPVTDFPRSSNPVPAPPPSTIPFVPALATPTNPAMTWPNPNRLPTPRLPFPPRRCADDPCHAPASPNALPTNHATPQRHHTRQAATSRARPSPADSLNHPTPTRHHPRQTSPSPPGHTPFRNRLS